MKIVTFIENHAFPSPLGGLLVLECSSAYERRGTLAQAAIQESLLVAENEDVRGKPDAGASGVAAEVAVVPYLDGVNSRHLARG